MILIYYSHRVSYGSLTGHVVADLAWPSTHEDVRDIQEILARRAREQGHGETQPHDIVICGLFQLGDPQSVPSEAVPSDEKWMVIVGGVVHAEGPEHLARREFDILRAHHGDHVRLARVEETG